MQFSQFYATNLSLNPAFTGATRYARVTAAQRLQWPNAQGSVTSSLLAYDRFFYYQKIGLGGLFQYDRLASGALNNFQVGPTASYLIYNQKKKYLRMGLGLNFVNKRYATSSLVFGDQLDPDFGKTIAQSQDPNSNLNQNKSYLDINTGILYNTQLAWVGLAVHHINKPNGNLSSDLVKTPIKYGLHAGYKIMLDDQKGLATSMRNEISFAMNLKHQGLANQLDVGSYLVLEPVTFGLWYRGIPLINSKNGYTNQDALVAMVGMDYWGFRLGYSYDVTISKLGLKTGGTHEVSLMWEFGEVSDPKKRKPGKMKTMYMPFPKL